MPAVVATLVRWTAASVVGAVTAVLRGPLERPGLPGFEAAGREDRRLGQIEVEDETGEGVAVLEAVGDTILTDTSPWADRAEDRKWLLRRCGQARRMTP